MGRATILMVGVFYLVVLGLDVVLLAAVQLRSSGGSTYDTWSLNFDSQQVLADRHREQLNDLQKQIDRNAENLSFTSQCLQLYDEQKGILLPDVQARTSDEVRAIKDSKKRYSDIDPSEGRCVFRGFILLKWDKEYYGPHNASLAEQMKALEKAQQDDRDQYAELVKGHQEFLAFKSMEDHWYTRPFVVSPYDLLVQLLVLSMGALGGMVRILRDYGDKNIESPAPVNYFVVPSIGAIVAMGGYVLAKTGLLLLSSSSNGSSLSPFMISLVGIVSGLLAKEVVERIAGAGRNLIAGRQSTGGQREERQTAQ